ncbi:hypothetical protein BpHYR1_010756 [Brachionus plicatilis]|uniref:Uncharacterized protein n=1 Tax=Brachionus plicatilis TaxID=10195 RepID=A0A3M7S0U8_BRAPC|nr:hypothetical protein BpHYR1_010756 [Brachionus plicatilis]
MKIKIIQHHLVITKFDSSLLLCDHQANAFIITVSGSVPFSLSPNMVKNMVKFIAPVASLIISSKEAKVSCKSSLLMKPSLS